MGRERLIDKSISQADLIRALQAGTITFAQAQQMFSGVIPIGDYKGVAAALDIDKLVNQPLVQAEGLYALDKIDARDILTINFNVPDLIGVTRRARLGPVPAGEVWFINRLVLISPAALTAEAIQVNFRVSPWAIPDLRVGLTADADGRSYWPADQGTVALNTYTVDLPAQGELGAELRLEAGAVITLVATLTGGNATGLLAATLTPFGRKGKVLVA